MMIFSVHDPTLRPQPRGICAIAVDIDEALYIRCAGVRFPFTAHLFALALLSCPDPVSRLLGGSKHRGATVGEYWSMHVPPQYKVCPCLFALPSYRELRPNQPADHSEPKDPSIPTRRPCRVWLIRRGRSSLQDAIRRAK